MTDGSALYSISLRKPFEDAEINCINEGGLNESTVDYRKIAAYRW